MNQFTLLWSSLVTSSVWQTSKETRLVWITLLAMKDKDGVVQASIPGMARMAGVTVLECEAALNELSSPDKYSRTKANEGRRIAACEGGWHILNHLKYRNALADRKEYWRSQKAKNRASIADKKEPKPLEYDVLTSGQIGGLKELAEPEELPSTATGP